MKDKVVHRTTLDQDVGIIGREPMEVVDGPLARQHVVVLALHGELAAIATVTTCADFPMMPR
jgi:hypothetical protein